MTPAPRAFGGIYSAATGGTKYIDADGTLLQAGLDAAAQCTGTDPVTEYTWYAQYTCGTPTINTTNESSAYRPTMDGYRFLGWASTQPQYAATADAETETHLASLVDSNLPSCITEDTPIYPVWAPETYEIEYRCGTTDISGNTIPGYNTVDNPVTARYYNDFPIYFDRTYTFRGADNCTAPTGYEFVEWDCSENNTTITHNADESISWQYQYGLRCTAKWRAKEYQVNYECYDTLGSIPDYTNVAGYTGTPNVANTTATYNQNYQFQLSSNCPTPTGYVFDGWHCIPSDTNVAASNYGSGQQIMPWTNDYNLRCVAKWKGERITLHWNSNNGDPRTIADSSCTYTEQVGLPTNPTRTGFRFKGWEVVETPQEVQIPDVPVANP